MSCFVTLTPACAWQAHGLLAAKDKAGIPTLIDLLTKVPMEISWQAEELLRYVAGRAAPKKFVGSFSEGGRRAECCKDWEAWWLRENSRVDLNAQLDSAAPTGAGIDS